MKQETLLYPHKIENKNLTEIDNYDNWVYLEVEGTQGMCGLDRV